MCHATDGTRVLVKAVAAGDMDNIFSVRSKDRCFQLGRDSNEHVPIASSSELRFSEGVRSSRGRASRMSRSIPSLIKHSQTTWWQTFGVTHSKGTPMVVGLEIDVFDAGEPDFDEPFRLQVVGHLMRLVKKQTRPIILNACVRVVARYSHAPTLIHREATRRLLMYVRGTTRMCNYFLAGHVGWCSLEEDVLCLRTQITLADASRATDRRSASGGVVMYTGAH